MVWEAQKSTMKEAEEAVISAVELKSTIENAWLDSSLHLYGRQSWQGASLWRCRLGPCHDK